MNEERILKRKEWNKNYKRDVNGMPALSWKVHHEDTETIIYKTKNKHYDLCIIFPCDLEALHALGYIQQITFENGIITVFIDKWKEKKKLN